MAVGNNSSISRQVSVQSANAFNQVETSSATVTGLFEVTNNRHASQPNIADDRSTLQYATTVRIRRRKLFYGVALAVGGAVCFAGTTFCVRRSLRSIRQFYAPFFLSYFMTSWTILFYPVYVIVRSVASKGSVSLRDILRDSRYIMHSGFTIGSVSTTSGAVTPVHLAATVTVTRVIAKFSALALVWTLATYLFARGASNIDNTSDVTALFGCYGNFIYVLSWIVLQQQFVSTRIMAFIVSMTGVIMITYNRTENASEILNCSVLTLSTAAAAFYQVLMQLFFNTSTSGQLSLCQSAVGLFYLATVWPLFLLFYYTGVETIDWTLVPWVYIAAASAFAIGVHVTLMYGRLVTSTMLVESCLLLSIPCAVGIDIVFHGTSDSSSSSSSSSYQCDAVQITAYILIAFSFGVSILPPDWTDNVGRMLCLRSRDQNDATWRGATTATANGAAFHRGRRLTYDQQGSR